MFEFFATDANSSVVRHRSGRWPLRARSGKLVVEYVAAECGEFCLGSCLSIRTREYAEHSSLGIPGVSMKTLKTALSSQPVLVVMILFMPAVLSSIFLLAIDFLAQWKNILFAIIFSSLHYWAICRIVSGRTCSIPWYYYTVNRKDSREFKWFSIFLLLLPIYAILAVSFAQFLRIT